MNRGRGSTVHADRNRVRPTRTRGALAFLMVVAAQFILQSCQNTTMLALKPPSSHDGTIEFESEEVTDDVYDDGSHTPRESSPTFYDNVILVRLFDPVKTVASKVRLCYLPMNQQR
jgi:hypothetical protein